MAAHLRLVPDCGADPAPRPAATHARAKIAEVIADAQALGRPTDTWRRLDAAMAKLEARDRGEPVSSSSHLVALHPDDLGAA